MSHGQDMEEDIDVFSSGGSHVTQGNDVHFPVNHVATTNLTMPSISPSQYICDMLGVEEQPFAFDETYNSGHDYHGQAHNPFENIVDNIFCDNSDNATDSQKMRNECNISPDSACTINDSQEFYPGYHASSYRPEYIDERGGNSVHYDSQYCEKGIENSTICEDSCRTYERQYQQPAKRSKLTDPDEFARWTNKHPENWSPQEVLDWIFFAAEKNGIDCGNLCAENFRSVAGLELCRMGLEGFLQLEPNYGRLFYGMFRTLCDGLYFTQPSESHQQNSPKANDMSYSPLKPRDHLHHMNSESTPLAPSYYAVPDITKDMIKMESNASQFMHEIPGLSKFNCQNMPPMPNPFQASHLKHHPLPPYGHIPSQLMYPNYSMQRRLPPNSFSIDDHMVPQPIRRRPGRPRIKSLPTDEEAVREKKAKNQHLWEFIYEILMNPMYNPQFLRWENQREGVFRFVQSEAVAQLWGGLKNNENMTYEKLSRAMRHYYKRGILERVEGRRLVYKFSRVAMERVREKRHSI